MNDNKNHQKQIFEFAIDEKNIEWRSFLFDLINKNNMDPFDIDLSKFTIDYLDEIRKNKNISFNLTGKFLTIAIYLLKLKSEKLLNYEIENYSTKINELENSLEEFEEFEDFEDDYSELFQKRENYKLDFKNPLERKRKVSIFDLVETLEKTLKQTNIRQKNFLQKKEKIIYDGPEFVKKQKDLKTIIEEVYIKITEELNSNKFESVNFNFLLKHSKNKMQVLESFIPLLHLHNQEKIIVSQKNHFGDIEIKLIK